jgi:peptidoglycan/LPS O-acetylase OafA/YrhL
MAASVTATERAPGVDALRVLAAALVFGFHMRTTGFGTLPGPLGLVSNAGNSGVFIFFVISGFVLYRQLQHQRFDLRPYALRRFLRIYPAYIAALIGTALLTGMPFDARYLVFAQTAYLGDPSELMRVAWTLQVEVLFYAALPFAVVALSRVPQRWRIAVLLTTAVIWASASALLVVDVAMTGPWTIGAVGWTFPLGMAAALVKPRLHSWHLWIAGAVLVCIGLYVRRDEFTAAGGAVLLIAAMGWKAPRWLSWSGSRLSYPFYLWHLPLLSLIGDPYLGFAAALGISGLSWVLVERPALGLTRRLGQAGRRARTDPAASVPVSAKLSSA